ncbi:MAG TPA: 4,5-dihydroxyphthalate decarboxylase [Mycobacterium sp.]|nr:4,5-dihydroxyphthalate decarboxylase [Mycobacterium sp.]
MSTNALKIGCFHYDTTSALFDGSIGIDGIEASFVTAPTIPEIFQRMMRDREFDVAELGLTFYLRTLDADSPFVAIPVFPNRVFRHSSVFVNADSGIEGPNDLAGRTIGEFGMYGQDSGIWAKGILSDEYGFRPEESRWVIGGLDAPMPPFDFVPHPHPANVEVTVAPEGSALSPMLEAGEIDALFTANVPQCVLDGSPRVKRLFPDFEPLERDYYRRTGIFPIMHTVVFRRELLDGQPDLAPRVYRAFLAAKDAAVRRYNRGRRIYEVTTMVPWMNALVERNRSLFPGEWWPYGLAANRTTLDTCLRYHFEQGISARRRSVEEIFAPDLPGT